MMCKVIILLLRNKRNSSKSFQQFLQAYLVIFEHLYSTR